MFPQLSHAFPEMIRAGYTNCTSCHISPDGGGVLNPYGRQSSASVLSTWGSENEASAAYGLLGQPKWIDTQAYIKGVENISNNAAESQGHFWLMEFDGEAALHFGVKSQWTADLTLGVSPDALNGLQVPGTSAFVSRRLYLMNQLTEESSLRAGKFVVDYGVYFPDHTIPTRQGLGFDQGMETYNLEYSYKGDHFSGAITADLGRFDDKSLHLDKGVAATSAWALNDISKIGWSVFFGTENSTKRELMGPFALIGFNAKAYLLAEFDFQWTQPSGSAHTQGLVSYERLGYEIFQGFQIYLTEQTSIYDFGGNYNAATVNPMYGLAANRFYGVGPGVSWYPRPHFSFELEGKQEFSPAFPSAQSSLFLVSSFYL